MDIWANKSVATVKLGELLLRLLLALGVLFDATAFAQGTLYGTVSITSSVPIFGRGSKSVLQGTLRACASGSLTVQPADVYVHLGSIGAMNPADAAAILTKSFGRTGAQTVIRDIALAAGGIGMLAGPAGSAISISAKTLGYLLFGTTVATQELSPLLAANQPNVQALLSNTLDSFGTQTLAGGQCMPTSIIFISAPPKNQKAPLSADFSFIPGTPPANQAMSLHAVGK